VNHGVVRLFASSVAAFLTFGIALSLVGAEIAEGPGAGRQATSAAYNYDAPAAPTTPSPSAQTGAIRRYDHPAQRLRRAIAAVDSRLAAEGGGAITRIIRVRPSPGADNAISRHIIEKQGGETISVTHQVTRDGEVIHQHQTHIGKGGGQRQFPNEWVEFPDVP
jgi:hypothetical protein